MRKFECLGGPLDGRRVRPDGPNRLPMETFKYVDEDGRLHVYRLCHCAKWDERKPDEITHATYYHYLGGRFRKGRPTLIPHERKFK